MTRNGTRNGYVQVFKGPDGDPMVVLRAEDFAAILQRLVAINEPKIGMPFVVSGKAFSCDTTSEEMSAVINRVLNAFDSFENHFSEVPADEEMEDTVAFKTARGALEKGSDEILPAAMAEKLVSAEAPLRVWRNYRGMTQTELAKIAGVGQDVISKIETGKSKGDVESLKNLADALGITIDDLVA